MTKPMKWAVEAARGIFKYDADDHDARRIQRAAEPLLAVVRVYKRLHQWDETGGKSDFCLRSELVDRLSAALPAALQAMEEADGR